MSKSTCSVDGCEASRYGHGYCQKHWKRWRKYGTHELPKRDLLKDSACSVADCGKPHAAGGFCSAHYTRLRRYGDPMYRIAGEVIDGKRICPRCEVDTPIELMGQAWCRSCANAYARDWAKMNYVPVSLGVKACDYCGTPFNSNGRRNVHCSDACLAANKDRRNWKHLQKRRARMKDAFVESFHRQEILERDNWLCGICGEAIDPESKHPDKMSASIDHIIPIARGGTHERSNVQAAHLGCNVSKGASLVA